MMDPRYDATIATYDQNASSYDALADESFPAWERYLVPHVKPGARLLDWGAGSGVYAKRFLDLGFDVSALDGSPEMCRRARQRLGRDVRCLTFDAWHEDNAYDAIFACAVLVHVSAVDQIDLMRRFHQALAPGGVLYISVPDGDEERMSPESHVFLHRMTREALITLATRDGRFQILTFDTTDPVPKARVAWRWHHIVLKRQTLVAASTSTTDRSTLTPST